MATRSKIKPLSINAEVVRVQAATEQARKHASKKALKESLKPEARQPDPTAEVVKGLGNALAYLTTMAEDAKATDTDFEAYVLAQLEPTESTKKDNLSPATYSMRALRTASEHYVTGKNGNPHCGDEIGKALADLPRDEVIRVLIKALKLESNPYSHLNPGQQSMNLRNKARGALKNGFIKIEDIMTSK